MAENTKNSVPDLNDLVIEGRLTRDPELTTLPSGTNVCDLRIAVNRGSDKEGNELAPYFFDVKVWNGQGEACAAHLEKGRFVRIKGELAYREFEHNGQKQSRTFIVASREYGAVRFGPRPNGQAAAAQASAEADEIQAAATSGAEDDIPF